MSSKWTLRGGSNYFDTQNFIIFHGDIVTDNESNTGSE